MHNEIIKATYTITDDTRRFDFNDDCHVVMVMVSEDRKKITFGYYKDDKAIRAAKE